MRQCFPWMTLGSLLVVPLMDPPGLTSFAWLSASSVGIVLMSAMVAFLASWSATLIFGLIGALAHVLLGQLKTASVLIIGALFFDARTTPKGLLGAVLALLSIAAFTLLKLKLPFGASRTARRMSGRRGPCDSDSEGTPLTGTGTS